MKKLFVILLVLALLVPMGMVVHAEESADKPFYLATWSGSASDFTNVYNMPYMWVDKTRLLTPTECCPFGGEYGIVSNATALKEQFDKYPDGARYINFSLGQVAFRGLIEDAFFVEKGVAVVKEYLDAFIPYYKSIGGKLDGIIFDVEIEDADAYAIQSRHHVNDPMIYDKIVNNPAYQEKIRPQLVERGFKFFPKPNEYTPEIYSIHTAAGAEYAQSREIWNTVTRNYVNQSITESCKVVWEYYPNCQVSDYQSEDITPWVKSTGEYGSSEGGGGIGIAAGNSSNQNYYSVRPYAFFGLGKFNTVTGYNRAVYEDKTFNYFQFDVNVFKGTYLGAVDNAVSWWIAHYMYNLENPNSVSMTPYYAETLLHMCMLDPTSIMGYIVSDEVDGGGDLYESCLNIVDKTLQEVSRLCGKADREPINVQSKWNNHYVLSGMRVENKNIWRITPDTDLVSKEDFLVEGTADPTFYVNGQTVTFPQGKIIADGNIPGMEKESYADLDNQTYGYWIETPAGVNAIETRAENYFVEYPSFVENFDSYEAGMEYNYKNALPATCWEVKKSGSSSATVIANPADAADKVLALKGNYTLRLVNLPKNISAAESYAENQAWQVNVTIPADLSAEAEIVLLSAGSEKKKSNDGGFKIAGGKVYYSQNGEYVEMAGVTLSAGIEYTLKREMDFNNKDELKSSYYVYDNTGTLLGKAKNVAMSPLDIPVATISMSCNKVNGEAVLLDDYKIYLIKVGTDFELYNANHGMKITDLDTPSAVDTAYRFAWQNTTNEEKSYTVIAQYYNGDTMASEEVIKEVKMAPNSEGAEFGVVELGDKGKAVKIFVKDNNPPEEDEDTTDGTGDNNTDDGDKNEQGGSFTLDTTMIIIIAAAAAVLIAVVVIVIVVSSKKKAAKEAAVIEETPAVEETAEQTPAEETPETDAE